MFTRHFLLYHNIVDQQIAPLSATTLNFGLFWTKKGAIYPCKEVVCTYSMIIYNILVLINPLRSLIILKAFFKIQNGLSWTMYYLVCLSPTP